MTIDLKDRLYTSSEVAEILGVSLRSVYRYLEEGKLDADIKTATGRHRFSRKNILDFLKPSENNFSDSRNSNNNSFQNDNELDALLDLPALGKTAVDKGKEDSDDFDFDFDEEFFKSLEKGSLVDSGTTPISENPGLVKNGEYQDDDLEKLLREFEEQELREAQAEHPDSNINQRESKSLDTTNDDDELSNLLKSLELDIQESVAEDKTPEKKDNIFDDFDFDLDFNLDTVSKETPAAQNNISSQSHKTENEEDDEDNWLERFRKAAEKNTVKKEEKLEVTPNNNFGNIFDKQNLDVFFDNKKESELSSRVNFESPLVSSISNNSPVSEVIEEEEGKYEYHYTSSLGGLKEIAQTVDKVSKKFDIDYAFTLNAGLSLHKPIAPFSTIHLYVREKDLEIYEDYLKLNPASENDSVVCLITQDTNEVFRDCYDLHGLNVVSNVQLRSDLIDKGLDKLAREI